MTAKRYRCPRCQQLTGPAHYACGRGALKLGKKHATKRAVKVLRNGNGLCHDHAKERNK